MSNVFKNLKSLFIEEVDDGKPKPKATAPEKKVAPQKASPPPAPVVDQSEMITESTEGQAGQVQDKFINILFEAMSKNDLEGFDYLEYKKSLSSLKKMPMDDATRYKSAFAMASTMGATPDQLVQTANHYVQVLKKEEQKFEQALEKQLAQKVGNRQQQMQQLDQAIKHKAEQIKKLTAEIEQHQAQQEKIKKEVGGAKAKLETTKNNFIASYNALVAQIEKDIANMKTFLK